MRNGYSFVCYCCLITQVQTWPIEARPVAARPLFGNSVCCSYFLAARTEEEPETWDIIPNHLVLSSPRTSEILRDLP